MREMARPRLAVVVAIAALIASSASAGAAPAPAGSWIGSWAASPFAQGAPPARPNPTAPPRSVQNQTIRQVVRLSLGGSGLRVRLTNEYGDKPLTIGAAHVALVGKDGAVVPGSDRTLTFAGKGSTTIPAYAPMVSDPVALTVPPLSSVAISIFYPEAATLSTTHAAGQQTAIVSPPGDFTAAAKIEGGTTTTVRVQLAGVEVEAAPGAKALVTLGDSITDGTASTVDANHRWPDRLAERLSAAKAPVAVLNEGIAGNRVLHDLVGPNLLSRLDRDVLSQPHLAYVVFLEGINDIGFSVALRPDEAVSAEDVIAGYRQVIARVHDRGAKIYGATLTPFRGANYFSEEGETKRQAVNRWIRTSGAFDAVIDFEAAVRDPADPSKLNPAFDSGDHLHPSDAGYVAMAAAVDLKLFQ